VGQASSMLSVTYFLEVNSDVAVPASLVNSWALPVTISDKASGKDVANHLQLKLLVLVVVLVGSSDGFRELVVYWCRFLRLELSSGMKSLMSPIGPVLSIRRRFIVFTPTSAQPLLRAMVVLKVLFSAAMSPVAPDMDFSTIGQFENQLTITILVVLAVLGDHLHCLGISAAVFTPVSACSVLRQFCLKHVGIRILSLYTTTPWTVDRLSRSGKLRWLLRCARSENSFRAYLDSAEWVNLLPTNLSCQPVSALKGSILSDFTQANRTYVVKVSAQDNDDLFEGQNAALVYTLEKNVIDEGSGRPIFSVDSHSGQITSALCCLDREKTSNYVIQVVATDGGGLKGTGTVLVHISDENDVPPRFSRPEWIVELKENHNIAEPFATIYVIDKDMSNNFTFRVITSPTDGCQKYEQKE
ncbi:unnamed protein product, partial [Meganyctiphanes norvegica]